MENSKKYLDEQFASLIETLKDELFKEELINNINEDIDIPILSEKTEKKMIDKLYSLFIKHVEKAAKKI
tara:strand:+ start:1735 stop:1941 length:207 start_codon:yes stop_codon:yes gene_type:complete